MWNWFEKWHPNAQWLYSTKSKTKTKSQTLNSPFWRIQSKVFCIVWLNLKPTETEMCFHFCECYHRLSETVINHQYICSLGSPALWYRFCVFDFDFYHYCYTIQNVLLIGSSCACDMNKFVFFAPWMVYATSSIFLKKRSLEWENVLFSFVFARFTIQ